MIFYYYANDRIAIFRRWDVKLERFHICLFRFHLTITSGLWEEAAAEETHADMGEIMTVSKHTTTNTCCCTQRPPLVGSQNIPAVRPQSWTLSQPWRCGRKYRKRKSWVDGEGGRVGICLLLLVFSSSCSSALRQTLLVLWVIVVFQTASSSSLVHENSPILVINDQVSL